MSSRSTPAAPPPLAPTTLTASALPHTWRESARLSRPSVPRLRHRPAAAWHPAPLLTFTVSTSGTIGTPGRALLGEVSRRLGRSLPVALLDDATWAAPHFGPYARMSMTIALAARRAMALSVRRYWGSEEQAVARRPPDPPAGVAPCALRSRTGATGRTGLCSHQQLHVLFYLSIDYF